MLIHLVQMRGQGNRKEHNSVLFFSLLSLRNKLFAALKLFAVTSKSNIVEV